MDLQRYLKEISPESIIDVIEISLLKNLLNGHSYSLGSGTTLLIPNYCTSNQNFLRINAIEDEPFRTFGDLCKFFRYPHCANCNEICESSDEYEAKKYFIGERKVFRVYCCKPLGLWDMTYPIMCGKKTIGVLFGGQKLVKNAFNNYADILSDVYKFLDWEGLDSFASQKQLIECKVNNLNISQDLRKRLLIQLHEKHPKIELSEFKQSILEFQSFGNIIQDLFNALYQSRKNSTEQSLLRICDEELLEIDLSEEESWWENFSNYISKIENLPQINKVIFFTRDNSRYVLRNEMLEQNYFFARRMTARFVINYFPINQLIKILPQDYPFFILENQNTDEDLWGYRSNLIAGKRRYSTLIILSGSLPENDLNFYSSLCGVFSASSDFANMVFHDRQVDLEYQRKVEDVAHSFATPLQIVSTTLGNLKYEKEIANQPTIKNNIQAALENIDKASIDVDMLLDIRPRKEVVINYIETINEVIKSMDIIAREKRCEIIRKGSWPERIMIRGNPYLIEKALICLIDNAIKYSFQGLNYYKKNYEVRIAVIKNDEYVKTIISNYGVGIPENKIDEIKGYNSRGEITDPKRNRPGSGRGLPMAIRVFEGLGGYLEISSVQDRRAPKNELEKYLRYITTVEAAIPLSRRNE